MKKTMKRLQKVCKGCEVSHAVHGVRDGKETRFEVCYIQIGIDAIIEDLVPVACLRYMEQIVLGQAENQEQPKSR